MGLAHIPHIKAKYTEAGAQRDAVVLQKAAYRNPGIFRW
jgi:hypothetical protein